MIRMINLDFWLNNIYLMMLTTFIIHPLLKNIDPTWTMNIMNRISIRVFTYLMIVYIEIEA